MSSTLPVPIVRDEAVLEATKRQSQQAKTRLHVPLVTLLMHCSAAGRSQFVWPHPGQPRMPADESLFLQPAPESAGNAAPDFCLGVVQVTEVSKPELLCVAVILRINQSVNTSLKCWHHHWQQLHMEQLGFFQSAGLA
jgi:hypothetical protein